MSNKKDLKGTATNKRKELKSLDLKKKNTTSRSGEGDAGSQGKSDNYNKTLD